MTQIRQTLEKKYGEYITQNLMTENDEVLIDKISQSEIEGQSAVNKLLKQIKDFDISKNLHQNLWNEEIEWGVDFSSWIGSFNNDKEFLFIGAEPHINKNYQLVYDFGNFKNKNLQQTALVHYNRTDIWHYVTKNFTNDLSNKGILNFLQRCYITDLCHIVPKGCGTIKAICEKLDIKQKDWKDFRTLIAKKYLIDEIKTVNPKYIVLHGAASRDFFANKLKVNFKEKYQIADWKRYILLGEFMDYKVIAIPHLKGQVLNQLWRSKMHPQRPIAAEKIIKDILNK